MQQQLFTHSSLFRIRHYETTAYLEGTPFTIQDGLQFVGGTQMYDGVCTFWVIEKVYPFTPDICYGDLVYFKNYVTKLYLNCKSDLKSDVTKQSLICISEQPDPFLLQSAKEDYNSDKKIQLLLNRSPLRIINAKNERSLHSHYIKYKNPNVLKYFEITGFHERDDNDYFEIFPVSQDDQEKVANYIMPQIQYKEQIIKDGSTITIRNWWSGQSLHSHDIKYKSTQTQEVTAKTMMRDDNDEWQIFQQIESPSILSGVGLQFKHLKTNSYLAHVENNKTKSQKGLQVCCVPEIPKQCWMIITLDSNPVKLDSPFFIFNSALNVYLTHLPNPSEQSTFQQEIALVPIINGQQYNKMNNQFNHGELIRIRHVNTKSYLKATMEPFQQFGIGGLLWRLRKQKIEDTYYLVGTTEENDPFTVWVLQKHITLNPQIKYGDLVYLKNYNTKFYINLDKNRKSEQTNQASGYVTEKKQLFILQGLMDIKEFNFTVPIKEEPLRIVAADGQLALHTHFFKYRNTDITGFHERDDNDYWEILKISQEDIQQFDLMRSTIAINEKVEVIKDSDLIIIRHSYSGFSLSNKENNAISAQPMPREQFDIWTIHKKLQENSVSIMIENQSLIQLRSQKLNQFLTQSNFKIISDVQQPNSDWMIINLAQQPLVVGSEFLLYDPNLKLYLAYYPQFALDLEQQFVLVEEVNAYCLWSIEYKL